MREFGEYLKKERDLRRISLEDIASKTKIRIEFLKAMEKGEFDSLPGEFYSRTYVRAYAKAIGLEESIAMEKYEDFSKANVLEDSDSESPTESKWNKVLQDTVASKVMLPKGRQAAKSAGLFLIAIVIVAGVLFYEGHLFGFGKKDQISNGYSENNNASVDITTGIAASDNAAGAQIDPGISEEKEDIFQAADPEKEADTVLDTGEDTKKELELIIEAHGECWYEIRNVAENALIKSGILQNNKQVSIVGKEALKVSLGKPDVVSLIINGESVNIKNDVRELIVDESGELIISKRW